MLYIIAFGSDELKSQIREYKFYSSEWDLNNTYISLNVRNFFLNT